MKTRSRSVVLGSGVAFALAFSAGAASDVGSLSPPSQSLNPALKAQALERLARDLREVRTFELGSRVTRVYGPSFSFGESAEQSARSFLAVHAGVLGARPEDLVPTPLTGGKDNTVQLMPQDDGTMKFTMVAYAQQRDGVPVYRGELRLLTRNEPGFPLVLVSSAVQELGDFRVDPALAANPAMTAAIASAQAAHPRATVFGDASLAIWAGTDIAPETPVLAVVFDAQTAAAPVTPDFDAWRIIADAATGRVIRSEPLVCHADVTGRALGMGTTGIKSAECNPEAPLAMKDLRITSGAATAFTDADGYYALDLTNGPATISANPRGRHFRVFSPTTEAPGIDVNVSAPGVASDILFNADNASELRRAEVNAYVQHVVVRDAILAASPDYPVISTQLEWRVNVGVAGSCNAFYFANDSTNFFNAGDGCPNMAYYDVCHHEYGHHLVQSGGSGQDQYGEGTADCMGVLISDQPVLGWGFFGSCDGGLRDARFMVRYPCNGEAHDCGRLISGCLWDTRNAMVASAIDDYRTILWRLTVNAVPLHAGQSNIAPDITIDWLTLDDNDGNIGNGTPHYTQIQAGFVPHNMSGPALDLGRIVLPDGAPPVAVRPGTPTQVRVRVEGVAATPIDGEASIIAKIGAGAEVRTPMTRVGENEYLATIPATPCLSTVSYAFTANTSGGAIRLPSGTAFYTALSAGSATAIYNENFSANTGWSFSESDATRTGGWERGVPVASLGAPTTDFDGDGACMLTDNIAGQDVDAQAVRLYSPTLDARGDLVYVSYARWFSNSAGPNPRADIMTVEINGRNGASTWTTLETVGPTGSDVNGGWVVKSFEIPAALRTSQFRIRFNVQDFGADANVEAAIDAVRLIEYGCVTCAADFNGDGFLDFFDYGDYATCFEGGACPSGRSADFNGDGFTDFFDYSDFVAAFETGC